MKKKKENQAIAEIKQMTPTLLALNGVTLIGIGVYGLFNPLDWTAFTGLLVGNLVSLGNFALIGYTANKALERKQEKKARFTANFSYGARYIGMFAIYAACLMTGIIGVIPSVIPLFFPRIYYLVYYTFHKADKE